MLTGSEHFYPTFRDAVGELAQAGVVLDLGSTHRFRKEMQPFAALLEGHYFALDYRTRRCFGERNVDVDGDICALPFRTGAVGGVLCIEVLEHVPDPQRAMAEVHRILCEGGKLLLTTPFMAGYHAKEGDYGDFYRYTHEGLRWLLRHFSAVQIRPLGGLPYRILHAETPARVRELVLGSRPLLRVFNAVDRRWPTRNPLRWLALAEK